jgi:glycosyltransferase involved in cell wall biosynthesis
MTVASPLVSVITPTFNHQAYIGPCIESVLAQTYTNWEQVIVDDGSTDRTPEIANHYRDSRIRYIRQSNKGIEALASTYNNALAVCRGELIAILEGDDLWPPEKLALLTPSFEEPDRVLAYGAVADLACDGTWRGKLSRSVRKRMRLPKSVLTNTPVGGATGYMLAAEGVDLVPPSTAIIRRSALQAIGGFQYFPDLCVTDFPTFLRLSLSGRFYYTPKIMGYRRRHLGSATFQNLDRILTYARRYVEMFLGTTEVPLTAAQREEIIDSWNKPRPALELTAGRLKLLSREWGIARAHLLRAIDPLVPDISLAAAAGWCSSWVHADIEGLLNLAGIASLKNTSKTEETKK